MRLRGMDTVEQRLDMVRAIEDYGLTATEAAQLWGVSRETWHKWRRRYDSEGIAGLADRSTRPQELPQPDRGPCRGRDCAAADRPSPLGPTTHTSRAAPARAHSACGLDDP